MRLTKNSCDKDLAYSQRLNFVFGWPNVASLLNIDSVYAAVVTAISDRITNLSFG